MKAICGKRRILIISFILFAVVMSFSILRYKHFHQTTPTEFNSRHWITHPRCRNRMVDDLIRQYRRQPMPFYGMTHDELTALLGTGGEHSTFDLTYTVSDNFWEVTKYIGFNFDADGNCIYFDVVETGRGFDAASAVLQIENCKRRAGCVMHPALRLSFTVSVRRRRARCGSGPAPGPPAWRRPSGIPPPPAGGRPGRGRRPG